MPSIGPRTRIAVASFSATSATEVGRISGMRGATAILLKIWGSDGSAAELLSGGNSAIVPNWTGIAQTAAFTNFSSKVALSDAQTVDLTLAEAQAAPISALIAVNRFACWPTKHASLYLAFAAPPGAGRTFTVDAWPIYTHQAQGNMANDFAAGDMPDAVGR